MEGNELTRHVSVLESIRMKRRLTPEEKKKLADEKDPYVSGGESRHAFRKNWAKKKAMLSQNHRHHATEKLSMLEKLGDIDSIEDSQMES